MDIHLVVLPCRCEHLNKESTHFIVHVRTFGPWFEQGTNFPTWTVCTQVRSVTREDSGVFSETGGLRSHNRLTSPWCRISRSWRVKPPSQHPSNRRQLFASFGWMAHQNRTYRFKTVGESVANTQNTLKGYVKSSLLGFIQIPLFVCMPSECTYRNACMHSTWSNNWRTRYSRDVATPMCFSPMIILDTYKD